METAMRHGVLSWRSILVRAMTGHTCATHFPSLPRTAHKKFEFVLVAKIPCRRSPDCQKKQMSVDLILDLLILLFFRQGEFAVCQS